MNGVIGMPVPKQNTWAEITLQRRVEAGLRVLPHLLHSQELPSHTQWVS